MVLTVWCVIDIHPTSEVISCTIASLRTRADQYDQDARVAENNIDLQARSALQFTEQAQALRAAADEIEAATLNAGALD